MASPPLTSTYPGAMGDVGVEDVCMDSLPTLAKECTEGDRSRPDILDERTDDGVADERHEGKACMLRMSKSRASKQGHTNKNPNRSRTISAASDSKTS